MDIGSGQGVSGLSLQAIMLMALVSALARAGLNLIDRHQIGRRRQCILRLNLWNNAVPAVLMAGAVGLGLGAGPALVAQVLDWRTAAFSAVVQAVAYSFSHAFRHLGVNQVTVAGKAADMFIPLGIFCATGHWDWGTYAFAVATTLVCLPMLWPAAADGSSRFLRRSGAVICVALTLQASLAPALLGTGATASVVDTLVFAAAVMVWRALWALLPVLLAGPAAGDAPVASPRVQPLFALRVLLTVTTQVSFIFAVGSPQSAVAWPILNVTAVMSMVLAALLLNEPATRRELAVVGALGALALLRFLTL